MYELTEGQASDRSGAHTVPSPVDVAFATLLDDLFTRPRVTYAPVREEPVYYGGHPGRRRHRRFVLRAGTDLDDPGLYQIRLY